MKLLHRILRGFIAYSIVILVVVTPGLYFLINRTIIQQVDEALQVHKREIQSRLEELPTEVEVAQWEDLDGEVIVQPLIGPFGKDSLYTLDVERESEYADPRQKPWPRKHKDSRNMENERYRVLSTSVMIKGKPYQLNARISLVESEDLIQTLGVSMFIVLLTLILGVVIINWWISKTVWSPFYDTLRKLKSFEIEKSKPVNLSPSNVKEFDDLNAVIAELTRRDYNAFVAQREFTENAAHEMQTPLAIFQSKVDLLLQTHPTEEQAALFESLLDATSRLNNLNKALLLLARIDNDQFPGSETIELHEVTRRLVMTYENEDSSSKKRINIDSNGACRVEFNPSLLGILLTNLISNAVRHSPAASAISIHIDENGLRIANGGRPLSIAPEKIFDRFLKETSNQSSLGLGLSIAKRICDTNDVRLTYSYENGQHVFILRFSKSRLSTKSDS